MDELLKKYERYNRVFLCWWVLCILSVFVGFAVILLNSDGMATCFIQIILSVASIIGLVVTSVKKNSVIREMAILLRNIPNDTALKQKLVELGIAKRDIRSLRTTWSAAPGDASSTMYRKRVKSPVVNQCPNCGSANMVKAKSDLMEFFQALVVFSLLGSVTPFALFAFGVCCILAVLTAIISAISGMTAKKMKCKTCGRTFEITAKRR